MVEPFRDIDPAVVRAGLVRLAVLWVHLSPDGPHCAGAPLDPDHHALRAATVVQPFHDALGKAAVPRGSLHASDYTID